MQAATFSLSGFGKLPTHGDFVRHNAAGPASRALDEWLQRGLFFLQAQRSVGLDAAYDAAPACGFLFNAGRGRPPLLGVVQPSRDQAGRKFPFVVAREVPTPAPGGDAVPLPVVFRAFLEQAAALVNAITAGQVAHRDVVARLEALDGVDASGGQGDEYRAYLRRTTLKAWCEALWGYFDDSRKYVLFKNWIEVLQPHRGNASPPLAFGLRFPLDEAAPTLGVGFWWDACRRLLQTPLEAPSCFWSLQAPRGAEAPGSHLLLFFQPPPYKAFGEALATAVTGESVFDLQAAGRGEAARAALAIPPRYGQLLEDEGLSLYAFLERL